jgi:hypothetical protein
LAALEAGAQAVWLPLGLEHRKVMNYKIIKASAFVFDMPAQRDAILKQIQKFEGRTGCGLEVLALRRTYGPRREGSVTGVLHLLYSAIRAGEMNLTRALNLYRLPEAVTQVAGERKADVDRRKRWAAAVLRDVINVARLPPEALPTAWVVTHADHHSVKRGNVLELLPARGEGSRQPGWGRLHKGQ